MPVYVDELFTQESRDPEAFRVGEKWAHRWCHLFADHDDLGELHKLAAEIGMKREWFQNHREPHYGLVPPRREAAIAAGAIPVDRLQALYIRKRSRHAVAHAKFMLDHPELAAAAPTVGVLPFRLVDRQLYVGLSHRHGTPRLRGLWGGAGGWVEPGENALDAALRELKEESGLEIHGFRLLFVGFYPGNTDDTPPRHYVTSQFAVDIEPSEVLRQPEPEKHSMWRYFSVAKALELPLLPGFTSTINDLKRMVQP